MGSHSGLLMWLTVEVLGSLVVATQLTLRKRTNVNAVVLIEVVDLVVDENGARHVLVNGDVEGTGGLVAARVVVPDFVVFYPVAVNLQNDG